MIMLDLESILSSSQSSTDSDCIADALDDQQVDPHERIQTVSEISNDNVADFSKGKELFHVKFKFY